MHNPAAWGWPSRQPANRKLIFSRHTQLGWLGLLTNSRVMGDLTLTLALTLGKAWEA